MIRSSILLLISTVSLAQAPQQQMLLGLGATISTSPFTLVTGAHGCVDNAGTPFSVATSTPFDASLVTLLIVAPTRYSVTASSETVADSSLNTYTPLTVQDSGAATATIYYKLNPAVSGTFTITDTTVAGGFPSFCFAGFSGGTPVYTSVENGAVINNNPVPTTLATGSTVPNADNQVLIAFVAHAQTAGSTTTINSSFTALDQNLASACCYQTVLAYQIQTSATTRNPTWDFTNAPAYAATAIAVFK